MRTLAIFSWHQHHTSATCLLSNAHQIVCTDTIAFIPVRCRAWMRLEFFVARAMLGLGIYMALYGSRLAPDLRSLAGMTLARLDTPEIDVGTYLEVGYQSDPHYPAAGYVHNEADIDAVKRKCEIIIQACREVLPDYDVRKGLIDRT